MLSVVLQWLRVGDPLVSPPGVVRGPHRGRGGGDERRLRVLQRLQPEAAAGPTLLALHRRLPGLRDRRRALQRLPVPGAVATAWSNRQRFKLLTQDLFPLSIRKTGSMRVLRGVAPPGGELQQYINMSTTEEWNQTTLLLWFFTVTYFISCDD